MSDRTDDDSYIRDADRVSALRATKLLDDSAELGLGQLTRLAQRLLSAPFAMISLIDKDRQVHKYQIGELPAPWRPQPEVPLSQSYCRYAVTSREPLIIENTRDHPLVQNNPATTGGGVGAYAGIPIGAPGGHIIGTLCVLDAKPREWSHDQIETLRSLADAVMAWLAERSGSSQADAQTSRAAPQEGDPGEATEISEPLFRLASELIASLDAYDACIGSSEDATGLLAREAEARAKVIQAEQLLQAAHTSMNSGTEPAGAATEGAQRWALREVARAVGEYFSSKARREDAVLRFQRGEVNIDLVNQEVLRTSSAEQALRLAVRNYAIEYGE